MPYNANENELEILKYWKENDCFEKSIKNRPESKLYVFYDGPPFATGLPHYGHIVASLMKDVVPRYFTMKGFRVERKWGWDCHGLPIENIVEKELGLKTKKDIETIGVEKFNETCRQKVAGYAEEWKKTIRRFGRWVDMENAYWTMDLKYMESVWWVFKELWDKGLIYEGYKSMHICPRCETTLSQQEVAEGYKDIKDLSVVAKFELVDEPGTFVLAWTTTPWTLPGNVALAVGEDVSYARIKLGNEIYYIAKDRVSEIAKKGGFKNLDGAEVSFVKGKDLVGKKYKPLFPYYLDKALPNKNNLYAIVTADFVTTTDGTGVVHIAPAFGEDDMNLGKEKKLPFIQNVLLSGHFTDEVTDFAGLNVKPIDDTKKTDVEVIKYLAAKGLLFAKEQYEHSYPHCWRCETPLINYATSSWFVNVIEIKNRALPLAEEIHWSPEHIKEGRFGKWLEGARDWSISRQRFWASVLPIWRCPCGETRVFGSVKELEEASGQKITDLHKHVIDKVTIPCVRCGKTVKRVPDVLDTWFDSGSMPYAQSHYPFENKEKFEAGFPAEFIAEGVDQTRAWFYYLHLIASAIKNSPAYKNVIVNGIVLAEDGKKMSKRLKNYPDPELVLEKYGADAMRYYLVTSPVMEAENLNFSEDGVREIYNRILNTLWNVFTFYQMFSNNQDAKLLPLLTKEGLGEVNNILDKWIIAELQVLIKEVSAGMDGYKLIKASRPIADFINEFSTWYLRRSRDRFKSEDEKEKQAAISVLRHVLIELSKVMAPFMPFLAEKIYLDLQGRLPRLIGNEYGGGKESVHLEDWPLADEKLTDEKLLSQMETARQICELGHSARKAAEIKVRQPLQKLKVKSSKLKVIDENLADLIKDELNIKEVEFTDELPEGDKWKIAGDENLKVALSLEISEDLKFEGILRELVRQINSLRKEAKLTINDKIKIYYQTEAEEIKTVLGKFKENILKETLAEEISAVDNQAGEFLTAREIEVAGQKIWIRIRLINN